MDTPQRAAGPVPADTSVVIVSYFTGPDLFDAIDSALRQDGVGDVVLVDNGNPDDALARLRQRAEGTDRLTVVTGQGNVGFGSGCNLGARAARGTYLLFLNPDARLPPGAVPRLRRECLAHPGPALIAPRLLDGNGQEQRGSRRNDVTPRSIIVEALQLNRLLPRHPAFQSINQHTARPLTRTTAIDVASGACMFFAAADFWRIGGFDERYFLHVEDIDICVRLRASGGQVLHVPDVEVRHVGGTSDAPALFVERHKAISFTRYFRTHFQGKAPPGVVPLVTTLVWARYWVRVPLIMLRHARIFARTRHPEGSGPP